MKTSKGDTLTICVGNKQQEVPVSLSKQINGAFKVWRSKVQTCWFSGINNNGQIVYAWTNENPSHKLQTNIMNRIDSNKRYIEEKTNKEERKHWCYQIPEKTFKLHLKVIPIHGEIYNNYVQIGPFNDNEKLWTINGLEIRNIEYWKFNKLMKIQLKSKIKVPIVLTFNKLPKLRNSDNFNCACIEFERISVNNVKKKTIIDGKQVMIKRIYVDLKTIVEDNQKKISLWNRKSHLIFQFSSLQ